MKALSYETDRYTDCAGYLGCIIRDWNVQGMTHDSDLRLVSLKEGGIVAMSFPIARNVSDQIAQKFTEEEYQYFAVGQRMRLLTPTSTDDVTCGIFDNRYWESNMPTHFKASDMVYLEKIPEIIREVFEMNGCEPTSENFDLMTAAAAGMLEGHSLQTLLGYAEEKEVIGENWHHGMLDFLGAGLLPMVTTAYGRATKKMRDAFIYQVEKNMAKHSQTPEG